MNYGVCAVRLDFIRIIRLKAPAFFGMPGAMTMSEIVSVLPPFLLLNALKLIPE